MLVPNETHNSAQKQSNDIIVAMDTTTSFEPTKDEMAKVYYWVGKEYGMKKARESCTNCCQLRRDLDGMRKQLNDSKDRLDVYSDVFSLNQKELEALNKRLETMSANNVKKDKLLQQKTQINHCLTAQIKTLKTKIALIESGLAASERRFVTNNNKVSEIMKLVDQMRALRDNYGLMRATTAANPLNTSPIVTIKSESVKSESDSD